MDLYLIQGLLLKQSFRCILLSLHSCWYMSLFIAQIEMYRIMPLKAISRAWGKFNQLDLPVMLRRPLLGLYVWMFDCKLDEAMEPELKNYRNLGEFFRRILKPDVRLVSPKEELVNSLRLIQHSLQKCLEIIFNLLYLTCVISSNSATVFWLLL